MSADDIAGLTTGYSPVSIERLLDEALICALRHGRRQMTTKDVLQAKLVTELGLSHDAGYQPEERHRIAVHEAGHALLAELCGRRVNVASILRRSDALGLVSHVDSEERHLYTPQQAMKLIHIALGGMVAEELEFGEASSGISSDLAAATTIAAQLVGSMGAGGSRLSLEAASVPGAANLVAKVLGDKASRASAERIIDDAETAARELMTQHRAALLAIATALHEQDELSGDEVRAIVAEHASGGRRVAGSRLRTDRRPPAVAHEDLLCDGRGMGPGLVEDVTDRQPAATDVAMATEVVQVPLVGSQRCVEPDRVVEAGGEQSVIAGAVLTERTEHRMRSHDGVGREIVGDVRDRAPLQQLVVAEVT